MKKSDFVLPLSQRLLLLLCMFLICYILTMVLSYLIGRIMTANIAGALRISALVQDVLAFIVPAVGTAMLVTRRPAVLLCLTRKPAVPLLLLVVAMAFISVPAQEAVVYWNYNIRLPESMAAVEEMFRRLEESAAQSLQAITGDTSIAGLILNILVLGIGAGVAEELLFRGCFQRLLTTAGVNAHVAIWTVAFVFSAMHFQFFGFVPRMLLGAYFGYLLLWSGSIWVPVAAHALNNTLYTVAEFYRLRYSDVPAADNMPELWPTITTAASVVLTAVIIFLICSYCRRHPAGD